VLILEGDKDDALGRARALAHPRPLGQQPRRSGGAETGAAT
jgi:hypothetical protein